MTDATRVTEQLAALDRPGLLALLERLGWAMVGRLGQRAEVWAGPGPESERVPLPSDSNAPDYRTRIYQLVQALLREDEEATRDALARSYSASFDVLRLKLDAHTDGTLPWESAEILISETRDLLLSAACAEVGRQPVFPSRKPEAAMNYIRSLRFGQTERGSFIVNALSPLPESAIVQPTLSDEMGDVAIPYPRRVLVRLSEALHATEGFDGIETAADETSLSAAVDKGVSANLCEAAAGVLTAAGHGSARLQFEWSPFAPRPDVASSVELAHSRLSVLRHISRVYREIAPLEEFELRGKVVGLRRAEGDSVGSVSIHGWTGAGFHKVSLEVGEPWYHTAVTAHDREATVVAVGHLVREGQRYKLQAISAFEVVQEDAEALDEEISEADPD